MNIPLFFGVVALLGGIYIWIGKSASKDLQSSDDYFLMGRNLTFFPLSLTLLATQLGGGTLLGAAQEAYTNGWIAFLFPLGSSLGLFALGLGYGGKLRQLNISTIAEIFEVIYRSRNLRYIASGLSIVALFFILIGQGIAARTFFVSMGANPVIFVIFWAVLITYTVMGGLKAVVNTDILQALFILAVLALAYFSIDLTAAQIPKTSLSQNMGLSKVPWMAWMFMPLLFILIEQDMGQRCFAAKSSGVISFSAFAAGTVLLLSSAVAIYFGVLARDLNIHAAENSGILIETVKTLTNPHVTTLFMVAIFMAVVSTADSLLCSISSNLSCDFLMQRNYSEKQRMIRSRSLTLTTGLSALALSFCFDNVVTVLLISYELSVCTLFVPITIAICSKNPSKSGAFLSIICGVFGFILFRFFDIGVPKESMSIGLSLFGYLIGAFTKETATVETEVV